MVTHEVVEPTPSVVVTPALAVAGVRKSYDGGKTEALRGVDLTIAAGERFALLGPNGAGKTTLVSLIATLMAPTAGRIDVFGHDAARDASKVRADIGYVPQDIALYPTLTADENLRFFGAMQDCGGKLLRERIDEALVMTGLESQRRKRVDAYSGGMKRRLNLAVGLLHHPRLLLLDEPTVGVDPQSRAEILDAVRALNDQHDITVLYTTHYMDEVEALCNRVAIIDHGEIIADDTVRALTGGGTGAALTVRCDRPELLTGRLQTTIGITDVVRTEDGAVSFTSPDSSAALAKLVQVAAADGIAIEDIAVSRVSLEQVFLRLTGRALRDE
jgi:ABC-2 type transport system ATP-binding protein